MPVLARGKPLTRTSRGAPARMVATLDTLYLFEGIQADRRAGASVASPRRPARPSRSLAGRRRADPGERLRRHAGSRGLSLKVPSIPERRRPKGLKKCPAHDIDAPE